MDHQPHGIIVIDKPEGKSSAFIDFIVRKITGAKKAGHIGTLDPFATGVLAVAINNGTKTIPYIKTDRKTYEFEITFGAKTDTSDKTGQVIAISDKIPSVSRIESIIPNFIGEISQVPSIYSAIKVGGRRAYELARSGQTPEMKSRKVTIFSLECSEGNKFRAEVSPGTYIRSLAEDIAAALGTLGHVSSLRRIKDGRFSIEQGISLDELEKNSDNLDGVLIPIEDVLDDIPVILVSCQDAENLVLGRSVTSDYVGHNGQYLASAENGFLELVEFSDGVMYPKKLFRSF